MEKKIEKHPIYKLNTEEVDFSNFRVLLVYAPKTESDVGGGTRILIDQNRLNKHKNEKDNTNAIDRLRQIQHELTNKIYFKIFFVIVL